MKERLKSPGLWAGVVLLVLVSAACVQLAPRVLPQLTSQASDDPTVDLAATTPATPVAAAQTSSRLTAPVRRGAIEERLPLTGRIAGSGEVPIKFPASGRVYSVAVQRGDVVQEGQVLLQVESEAIQRQLDEAQAELQTAQIRLDQSRAQSQADADQQQRQTQQDAAQRQRDAERLAQADAAQRQTAAVAAEANVRSAQAELDRVQSGPPDADVRTAQAAVMSAHNVTEQAQAQLAALTKGADPMVVQMAQREVAAAQTQVDAAQAEATRLGRGADPDLVRTAQRDLQRAQNAVTFAQAAKLDAKADARARAEHDQAVASAQLDLQAAQDQLAKAKEPPAPEAVAAAKNRLDSAKADLAAAKDRLEAIRRGAAPDEVDKAQAAVDDAQFAEDSANKHLDDIQSHPTADELRAARDKLAVAQAALDNIHRAPAPAGPAETTAAQGSNAVSGTYNVVLVEQDVARNQAKVDAIQHQLAATRLVAPFTGSVVAVQVHVGDALNPGNTVFTLASSADPFVAVDVTDRDLGNLQKGQKASVLLDGSAGPAVDGSLVEIVDSVSAGRTAHVAHFKVAWANGVPPFGAVADVQVTTNHKDGVLLVPKKAVREAGGRHYVQYQDASGRKVATVEVGITSDTDVEIVSGLTEGQLVYVGL